MFCRKCGKEVQDNWAVCPSCGQRLQNEKKNTMCGQTKEDLDSRNMIRLDSERNSEQEKNKSSARLILKISAIIMVICFFCPLYMVSCAGQEILELSGADLTFGIQYMDEEIEGSLVYALLLLLPLISLAAAFANSKKLEMQGDYEKAKSWFYNSAAGGIAMLLLLRYLTAVLRDAFEETAMELNVCTAFYIMVIASILSAFTGGYQAYLLELKTKKEIVSKGIIAAKSCGLILAGGILSFFVIAVIVYILGGTDLDSLEERYLSRQTEISETMSLSKADMPCIQIEGFRE